MQRGLPSNGRRRPEQASAGFPAAGNDCRPASLVSARGNGVLQQLTHHNLLQVKHIGSENFHKTSRSPVD